MKILFLRVSKMSFSKKFSNLNLTFPTHLTCVCVLSVSACIISHFFFSIRIFFPNSPTLVFVFFWRHCVDRVLCVNRTLSSWMRTTNWFKIGPPNSSLSYGRYCHKMVKFWILFLSADRTFFHLPKCYLKRMCSNISFPSLPMSKMDFSGLFPEISNFGVQTKPSSFQCVSKHFFTAMSMPDLEDKQILDVYKASHIRDGVANFSCFQTDILYD